MQGNNQQPQRVQINIPAAPLMLKGVKADYHATKHKLKQSRYPFDAGFDLYPARVEPVVTPFSNGMIFKIGTLLHVYIPPGSFGMITERSSSAYRLGAARVRTGIIDCGYTGEVFVEVVCLCEASDATMTCLKKMQTDEQAIAQLILMPVFSIALADWREENIIKGRGENGFGHTDGGVIQPI